MSDGRARPPLVSRFTTSQWFALAASALALVTATGTTLGVVAIVRLTHARNVVLDRNGPAVLAQLQLNTALVNQESGLRGFVLTGREQFLDPYRDGRIAEAKQYAALTRLLTGEDLATARRDTERVRAHARAWHERYVEPVMAEVRANGPHAPDAPPPSVGRMLFEDVRQALARQAGSLARVRTAGRTHFRHMANFLTAAFIAIVVLIGTAQIFEEPFVLTQGGPGDATLSAAQFVYREGITNAQLGYASAASVVLFAAIFVVTYALMRAFGVGREDL